MRNLLVPVDLSEISLAVVEGASCFGRSLASNLWLLHVASPPSHSPPFNLDRDLWRMELARGLREHRRQLHEMAEQLRSEHYHVFTRFVTGAVSAVILSEAERLHADLIVMGSHGHGNVYHALFGGVGQKVMRKAPCPVMLVSTQKHKSGWQLAGQDAACDSASMPGLR
jgi:nucleotide-binding universal stress UspA family protein